MFDYRPEEDTTSQAGAKFGLSFRARDVVQILKHKTSDPDYSKSVQSLVNTSDYHSDCESAMSENQRWWQAKVVYRAHRHENYRGACDDDQLLFDENDQRIGLVPSCLWRMEMIRNEEKLSGDKIRSTCRFFSRKKKKVNYVELNEDEIYERVVQVKKEAVSRMCLLLVGAPGVGRRTIKNSLIQLDPRFAYPKPRKRCPDHKLPMGKAVEPSQFDIISDTSKAVDSDAVDESGTSLYHHVPHHELVASANRGEYLEVGKYNDAWFGTKYDTIDRIIHLGLIPVLDIEPDVANSLLSLLSSPLIHHLLVFQSIKKLRNAQYRPFVVFIDAPKCLDGSNVPEDASIVRSICRL